MNKSPVNTLAIDLVRAEAALTHTELQQRLVRANNELQDVLSKRLTGNYLEHANAGYLQAHQNLWIHAERMQALAKYEGYLALQTAALVHERPYDAALAGHLITEATYTDPAFLWAYGRHIAVKQWLFDDPAAHDQAVRKLSGDSVFSAA